MNLKNVMKDDVGLLRNIHSSNREKVNVGLIEKWIEEFLDEAATKNTNSTGMRDEKRRGLSAFMLDRKSLVEKFKIKSEIIDRIYHLLFIHSIGFYEVLNELFSHATKESINVRSRIWIVYNILLE